MRHVSSQGKLLLRRRSYSRCRKDGNNLADTKRCGEAICGQLDAMLSGEIEPPQTLEEESIFYKINHRLAQLYEIMCENHRSVAKERYSSRRIMLRKIGSVP